MFHPPARVLLLLPPELSVSVCSAADQPAPPSAATLLLPAEGQTPLAPAHSGTGQQLQHMNTNRQRYVDVARDAAMTDGASKLLTGAKRIGW
jgi:hypothetical protein